MEKKVYAVFDKKEGQFQHPYLFDSDVMATRAFTQMVKNDVVIKEYPADFCVYYIGDFDIEKGIFSHAIPHNVILEISGVIEK